MKKWINGNELLQRWDILPLQLFGYVKEGLLPHTTRGALSAPVIFSTVTKTDPETGEPVEVILQPFPEDSPETVAWWKGIQGTTQSRTIWEGSFSLMDDVERDAFLDGLAAASCYDAENVREIETRFNLRQEVGAPKERAQPKTKRQLQYDRAEQVIIELKSKEKYSNSTLPELAEHPEVKACYDGDPPSTATLAKKLGGRGLTSKGRPKGR